MRARALAALSTDLARLPRAQLYPLFVRILRDSSERTRRDVLLDLAALAPVVFALGGEQATFLTARSILEIAQQWP